jgi:hypothetical protein
MNSYHSLFLQSINRTNYTDQPSFCEIDLPKNIHVGKCVELSMALIPNTFYNVNSRNNSIQINSVNQSLLTGNYTLNEFLSSLASLFPVGTIVNYDDQKNLVLISNDTPFTFSLDVPNSMYKLLGFEKKNYPSASDFTGLFGPKLYSTCIFVIIDNFTSCVLTSSENLNNVSFIIPNNVNKGDIIQFYSKTQFSLNPNLKNQDLKHLTVKFYDENGYLLEGLSDWSLALKLY